MLSSPLLPLYLIIVLSTLIFIESSIGVGGEPKYRNLKLQPESEAFWQHILSCVIFPFFF